MSVYFVMKSAHLLFVMAWVAAVFYLPWAPTAPAALSASRRRQEVGLTLPTSAPLAADLSPRGLRSRPLGRREL